MIQKLMTAPGSVTEDSAALLWDKPKAADQIAEYRIIVNGQQYSISHAADATVEGLQPQTTYEAVVRAYDREGRMLLESDSISFTTRAAGRRYLITEFGAVGDGVTLNTEAIQRAIEACESGGRVVVPSGRFVTGAVFLKSDMTLYLEEGAVLFGSGEPSDYPLTEYRWEGRERVCYASLINTRDCREGERLHDITIEGKGTIDANGTLLKERELAENKGPRGRAMALRRVDRLYLKDITVRHSPAWCVHPIYCEDVTMNRINVYTKTGENGERYDVFNGDGIDPDSCKNVYIFNSMIASQDDCIAIKSGRDEDGRRVGIPTENVRITNCRFRSGFGVALGSEMSGGVRNVLVQDCDYRDVYSVGSVKAPRGRGNVVENVLFEDCTFCNSSTEHQDCKWFRGAILVDQFYGHDDFDPMKAEEYGEGTAVIRNITFRNIEASTVAGNAIFLAGLPESPLQNIRLENVKAVGKYGWKVYNVNSLLMENVEVSTM